MDLRSSPVAKVWLALAVAVSVTFSAPFARAEQINIEANDQKPEAILLTGVPGENPTTLGEGVEIQYDPAALKETQILPISLQALRSQSREMQSESYKRQLREEVVIPQSSANFDRLDRLNDLSPDEINMLVARKNLFLTRLAKTLRLMRLPPLVINHTLSVINETFFENAKIIAHANLHVTAVGFGVSGGIGLSRYIAKALRKVPIFKDIPEKSGFWMATSIGIAITQSHENGWHRFKIEPFVEFRQATKILGTFASVGGGLFLAQGLEAEGKSNAWTTQFTKVGGFSLTQNEKALSFSTGLGVGLGWGQFTIVQGEGQAFALGREGLRRVYEMTRKALSEARRPQPRAPKPRVLSCSALFAAR